LSRNDYFGDWQTPPSYPYGLLQRDVIIAALGAGVCPPKAKVTRSNRVGCANIFNDLASFDAFAACGGYAPGKQLKRRLEAPA
jgi:hypothetical protein